MFTLFPEIILLLKGWAICLIFLIFSTFQLCQRLESKLEDYFNRLEITTVDKLEYMAQAHQRMT